MAKPRVVIVGGGPGMLIMCELAESMISEAEVGMHIFFFE